MVKIQQTPLPQKTTTTTTKTTTKKQQQKKQQQQQNKTKTNNPKKTPKTPHTPIFNNTIQYTIYSTHKKTTHKKTRNKTFTPNEIILILS